MKKNKKQTHSKLEIKPEIAESFNVSVNNRIIFASALTVAILTFLVYLPALNNGFVNWDDGVYVYENREIQSLNFRLFSWIPIVTIWHPVTMISFAVDYALWGLNPLGYHLTNNIIHALNTFLVFVIISRLVEKGSAGYVEQPAGNRKIIAALVVALLFGLHPVHVESVAWVSERKDVLSAFFFLLSLLVYLKYASESLFKKCAIFYGTSLALFILALMSKPVVTLPLVLLVLDFYPLQRLNREMGQWSIRKILIEKIPFLVFSFIASLVTIWVHHLEGGVQSLDQSPLLYRALNAAHACIFYIVKMILPLNLAPLYPFPLKINLFSVEYLGAIILLLAITFFCVWSSKRDKLLAGVWAFYLVTLIPTIGIVQVARHSAADRYTYLPSIGLFLLAGLGVARLYERYTKKEAVMALTAGLIIVLVVLSKMTIQQIAIWQDPVTLWSHEIKIFPDSAPVAYANRADAYSKLGNYPEAIKDLNMAIKVDPQYADAYTNRGLAYFNLGNYQRAMKDYDQAISINPKEPIVYNNRGLVYDRSGNYQQAIQDYNKAIELDLEFADAYDNRGGTYFENGDYQRAINNYNKAIELNPQFAKAYFNLGTVYNSIGNYHLAIENFTEAIELNPADAMYYNNRGSAYNNMGNYKEAINDYNMAVQLSPQDAFAYYNLGVVYSQLGNIEQSIINYRKAASLGLKEAQEMLSDKSLQAID